MTTTAQLPVFKGTYLYLIGFYLFCVVLVLLVTAFVDIEIPSAMGIIIVVVVGMAAGQKFWADNQRRMTTGEKARLSVIGAIAMLVISVLALVGIALVYGLPLSTDTASLMLGLPANDVKQILLIAFGAGLVISVLVLFFSVGFGERQAIKQHARLAAK